MYGIVVVAAALGTTVAARLCAAGPQVMWVWCMASWGSCVLLQHTTSLLGHAATPDLLHSGADSTL
jgi:hypothetical protein